MVTKKHLRLSYHLVAISAFPILIWGGGVALMTILSLSFLGLFATVHRFSFFLLGARFRGILLRKKRDIQQPNHTRRCRIRFLDEPVCVCVLLSYSLGGELVCFP